MQFGLGKGAVEVAYTNTHFLNSQDPEACVRVSYEHYSCIVLNNDFTFYSEDVEMMVALEDAGLPTGEFNPLEPVFEVDHGWEGGLECVYDFSRFKQFEAPLRALFKRIEWSPRRQK